MPLRPGDTVSLSIRPSVKIGEYSYLKTSATLSRTVGDDPTADVADMLTTVRALYMDALHEDLTIFGELTAILETGQISDLADFAIRHRKPHVTVSKASSSPRRPVRKVIPGS